MAVTLVGAGPGDAGLLTIKGREKLAEAEVVLFDRLVGDEILELIPQTAEKINVGKHVNDHPVPQAEINQILLEKGLAGKKVVRLKGGDPFVFGRGGIRKRVQRKHFGYAICSLATSSYSAGKKGDCQRLKDISRVL